MSIIDFPQGAARFSRTGLSAAETVPRPPSQFEAALQTNMKDNLMQLIVALEVGINSLRQVGSAFDHAGFDAARFDQAATEVEQLLRTTKAKAQSL